MRLQAKLLRKSSLRPFSDDDWHTWGWAHEFSDGSGPYIADIKCIDFPGGVQEATLVIDGDGEEPEGEESGAVINLSAIDDSAEGDKFNGWASFDSQSEALKVAKRLANDGLTYTEAVKLFELPYWTDQDRREGLMYLDDDTLLERFKKNQQ